QAVAELQDLLPEDGVLGLAGLQLLERALEAVTDADLPARQGTDELVLVVAGEAERVAGRHHAHHQAEHAGGVGAAVDEVAEEDRAASVGRYGVDWPASLVPDEPVAEIGEEGLQLRPAA